MKSPDQDRIAPDRFNAAIVSQTETSQTNQDAVSLARRRRAYVAGTLPAKLVVNGKATFSLLIVV